MSGKLHPRALGRYVASLLVALCCLPVCTYRYLQLRWSLWKIQRQIRKVGIHDFETQLKAKGYRLEVEENGTRKWTSEDGVITWIFIEDTE